MTDAGIVSGNQSVVALLYDLRFSGVDTLMAAAYRNVMRGLHETIRIPPGLALDPFDYLWPSPECESNMKFGWYWCMEQTEVMHIPSRMSAESPTVGDSSLVILFETNVPPGTVIKKGKRRVRKDSYHAHDRHMWLLVKWPPNARYINPGEACYVSITHSPAARLATS